MNLKNLTHNLTPDTLESINSLIENVLTENELDEARFLELVTKRDAIIIEHLGKLSGDALNEFARAELEINQYLETLTQARRKEAFDSLSKLIKGKKAIEKYK